MAATERSGWAVAAAGGAIALWSLNAAAAGAALGRLSVLQVLALQFSGALLTLIVARRVRGDAVHRSALLHPTTLMIGVAGLTGTIALQYVAFATAPLVGANAIAYAWPVLAAAWTALQPGGRRSPTPLVLAVIGFGGVVLLFAARDSGGAPGSAPLLGYLAALGSAVAMAGYTVNAGRSGARASDLLLVGTSAGALMTVPAALLEGERWSPPWAIALSLGIGVAMMAVGYGLWTRAMAHPAGLRLAPAAYATPLLSTALLLATGQQLTPLGFVGCGLIMVCAAGVGFDAVPRHRRDRGRQERQARTVDTIATRRETIARRLDERVGDPRAAHHRRRRRGRGQRWASALSRKAPSR